MKQRIFKFLADLRFAITILLVIACFSIIGTVIEQDQSIETYKMNYPLTNQVFGFLSWDIILKFGFDHVYKTWWFISLVFLFGLSLLTCTILQQLPALKISRRCQFFRTIQPFKRLQISTNVQNKSVQQLLFKIKQTNYSVFQQKNILYCYKGLIGRIAPIIVHFSMILILLGAILGSVSGFKAQEIVPKTETFHIQNILNTGQISLIPNCSARVNDFWITYTSQSTVKQFYSDLSILNEDGNEIKRQTISVNKPLVYKDLTIYQTDWSLIGLRVWTNDTIFQLPFFKTDNFDGKTNFVTLLPFNSLEERFNIIQLNGYQGNSYLYDLKGKLSKIIDVDEYIKENKLRFIDIIGLTGLQIKSDPGLPYIYFGFSFLMLSTILSYLSFSEIWLIKKFSTKQFMIGAKTTRAKNQLEIELFKFLLDSD